MNIVYLYHWWVSYSYYKMSDLLNYTPEVLLEIFLIHIYLPVYKIFDWSLSFNH